MEAKICHSALQRDKPDLLQDRVPLRIRHDFLFNAISVFPAGIFQAESRHPFYQMANFGSRIRFLLREEIPAIGDNEPHVANTGLVDARGIDFVEDAMAQREPDTALTTESCAHARFGAGSPVGVNSRCARRIMIRGRHDISVVGSKVNWGSRHGRRFHTGHFANESPRIEAKGRIVWSRLKWFRSC